MVEPLKSRTPKRAITLGGGGPAAGLHIGVLKALDSAGIKFNIWSLSCIGAWVGIIYNQCDEGREVQQTYEFFRDKVFRDDESYERFPINSVFGSDVFGNSLAALEFMSDPRSYEHLWQPHKMMEAFNQTMSLLYDHSPLRSPYKAWDKGDINGWILNQVMAPNPAVRYLTSLMYLSKVTGLSRINWPDSAFMKGIKFDRLFHHDKPRIFHNAWNLDKQELAFFSNYPMKDKRYKSPITASTLCACSALPFVEETVKIGQDTYCEGALVDTVNFESLLEEHPDLDEIWVSRIVDVKQIRKPENLHDGLANLCQLFAATVGEDDVKLFRYHVQYPDPGKTPWKGTVVEIQVPSTIDFKWNHSNLDDGKKLGEGAAERAIKAYRDAGDNKTGAVRFISEVLTEDKTAKLQARRQQAAAAV